VISVVVDLPSQTSRAADVVPPGDGVFLRNVDPGKLRSTSI
jgi:hypothetical protein